jgi:nicotinate-nucleotide--dimethylbenzimidazole phosphoribosyltransferase
MRARIVAAAEAAPPFPADGAELTTPEVAAAVDRGRELARVAAAGGATVLVGVDAGTGAATELASWLADGSPRPLGALRRLGDSETCVLAGLALGAGECGLGYLCDGLSSAAGAGVAAAVEPDLLPRLLAACPPVEPAHAALLAHLRLEPVVERGGVEAALAVLRAAAGA